MTCYIRRMDFLTAGELAEQLRVHQSTLARWRALEKGPAWVEVGGQFRYRREAVDAWIAANTNGGASAED